MKIKQLNEKLKSKIDEGRELYVNDETLKEEVSEILTYKNEKTKVFRFEWLTEEYRNYLLARIKTLQFKTNDFEAYTVDTPQIRLAEQDHDLYLELFNKFHTEISEVCSRLLGLRVLNTNTILFAKYSPEEFPIDSFHTDDVGKVTLTVPINEDFECGDFVVQHGGIFGEEISIPRAKPGEVTLFCGSNHYHRSSAVKKGERIILVFWCDIGSRCLKDAMVNTENPSHYDLLLKAKIDILNKIYHNS